MTYIFYIEVYDGRTELLKEMKADINHLEDFQMENLSKNGKFRTEDQYTMDIPSEEEAERILEDLRKKNPDKRIRYSKLPF